MDIHANGTISESLTKARADSRSYDAIAKTVLERRRGVSVLDLFFSAAVVRVRGLHDGAVREITEQNPYSSLTLIRAWAETCALLLYVTDHPSYVLRLMETKRNLGKGGGRKSPQALISHASERMPGLKSVYEELSEVAHFGAVGFWSAFSLKDDWAEGTEGRFTWTSTPRWRDEDQALVAATWVHELALASRHLLEEYADAQLPAISDEVGG